MSRLQDLLWPTAEQQRGLPEGVDAWRVPMETLAVRWDEMGCTHERACL